MSYPIQPSSPASAGSVRSRKIARIWCLARDLSMSGDLLHLAVEGITGKSSISKLSIKQMEEVISTLQDKLRREKRQGWRKNQKQGGENVAFLPTPQQRGMVEDLIQKIEPLLNLRNREAYLEAVCKRMYGRNFGRLTKAQAQGVIEALKSIYKRSVEHAGNPDNNGIG